MLTNIENVIRQYLPELIHMSLATSRDNKPWVCEVHFVFDEQLNLYFRSLSATRHCREIADNKFVAGNIVKQHQNGQKPRGIYFEGKAEVVENVDENSPAYVFYRDRFGIGKDALEEANSEEGPKFYKISVEKFYVFDAQESSPPQKYELEWGK
jgi:uncharacterized protein YhbP (UPF0306 family)